MRDTRYFTQRKMTEGSHPIRKSIILLFDCREIQAVNFKLWTHYSFGVLFSKFGDLNFDLLFFIKLIWSIRTRPIFKKINQTNLIKQRWFICRCIHQQITLFNKLIWPCINGFKKNFQKLLVKTWRTSSDLL